MKAIEQSFPVVLFITLYKVVISVSVFAKQKRKFEIFSIISVSVGSSRALQSTKKQRGSLSLMHYEQPLTPSIILPSITIVSSELFSLDAILYIEENHSNPSERFHFLSLQNAKTVRRSFKPRETWN